jgi:hypothetical protein
MENYARVKTDMQFCSTSFKLKKGEIVSVVRADKGYYVDPVDDRWCGAKMLVGPGDIKLF